MLRYRVGRATARALLKRGPGFFLSGILLLIHIVRLVQIFEEVLHQRVLFLNPPGSTQGYLISEVVGSGMSQTWGNGDEFRLVWFLGPL
jgi:hypothetical protein